MKPTEVTWHDVECAVYEADLGLWRELADTAGDPVLDLGCGTGRVALELAHYGHDVTGLDSDTELLAELARRARGHGLRVDTVCADARSFAMPGRFALAIAPMQVFQLMGGSEGRRAALTRVREHLEPGGMAAIALADPFEAVAPEDSLPPLPDVREEEGWVLSSQPVAVRPGERGVTVDRLRQVVSPAGELAEELSSVHLDSVSAEELEAEAGIAGLKTAGRREVEPTNDYIGSTIVLLEAP
jgi:SAM-dependent methyltransferase